MILTALAKQPEDRHADWEEFARPLSALIANREVPRGQLQGVLDSEVSTLLRSLDFFASFGDVELWRSSTARAGSASASATRAVLEGRGRAQFSHRRPGRGRGYRDGQKVATLGSGTSVG